MMLVEELLGKVINVCWGLVGISSSLTLIVDFRGFGFSKVYRKIGMLKVKKGVFSVVKFII